MIATDAAPPPSGGGPSGGAMSDALSEMVDSLVNIDAAISGLTAARTELLESMRIWSELSEAASAHSTPTSRDMAFRSLRTEVACAIRLPERTVENLFGEARMLVRALPRTFEALRSGEIGYRHAQVIVDQGAGLESEQLSTFERLAVPSAATSTPSAFAKAAHRLRESLDSSTLEQRTAAAAEKRDSSWAPARDGMADLYLHLPAHEVQAIYSRATEEAHRQRSAGDPRTLAQLRADIMRDALLNGTMDALGGSRVRPDVFVTVPVLTLLGAADIPATLDGYGPIAPSTARELAGHAPSFIRILTHPETGVRLSVGRDRYAVPNDMKNALRARDGTCSMPMCWMAAEYCDIDHTVDWAKGGTTSLSNLAFLCRGHHSLKHASLWTPSQDPNGSGVMTWRSPAGKTYVNRPGA